MRRRRWATVPDMISVRTGVEDVDEARRRREPDYADLAPGRYVYLAGAGYGSRNG